MTWLKERYQRLHAYSALFLWAVINFKIEFALPSYFVWIVIAFDFLVLNPLYNKSNEQVKKVIFRCMQVVGIVSYVISMILLMIK